MANHKSALKRIRQSEKQRLHNRYYSVTMRNAIKKLKSTADKAQASELLASVVSLIDKNMKRSILHKNKAANLKSKLTKGVNALAS
ncbi:MAG: 30S ribosomal protein S20 [Bacteroidales bacterium]|nr:30S ribosomal protein S20 [Bacteroidales bacterium]